MNAKMLTSLSELDSRLVKLASGLKLLSQLSWSSQVQQQFFDARQKGQRRLPQVTYEIEPQSGRIDGLKAIQSEVDTGHPLGQYLYATAQSYISVSRLLENAGSPRMTPYSLELYGRPGDSLAGGKVTNLDAARHFLQVATEYHHDFHLNESDYCLPAALVQAEMQKRLNEVFTHHKVEVVVAPGLVSKAAAGANRVRLRDGTCFSEFDLEQLLQHEAFVHSLTAINGREQPHFSSMGLGAPRTTATQEGLATFSELITGAIDISRLERIALRIVAIDMALNGADFIEVFEYFVSKSQSETESFNSAMRVFRGAPTGGGSAFTKDTVYLHGLMEIHTFFRWCMSHQKLTLARQLFAGRMTISDVIALQPFFEEETLKSPLYLPPWMGRGTALSAYLAFSVFANQIRIEELDEGYQFDKLEEMGI
ncbi:MAG: flavohemoglobin expression-modulating QEGLA motif protein [Gammaproteobacteria bacterium]|nr:flavohemoglobin expression-modulating QEGLA motif protein [Gammaproteobacteria bacterium]